MANRSEILSVLRSLSRYFGREPGRDQVPFYLEYLADLDPDALRYAVQLWIKKSPFFPKVNELRQAASEYQPRVDYLAEEYQRLYDAFYAEQELDPTAWEKLALAFEHTNRPYRAEHTRKKFETLRQMLKKPGGMEI